MSCETYFDPECLYFGWSVNFCIEGDIKGSFGQRCFVVGNSWGSGKLSDMPSVTLQGRRSTIDKTKISCFLVQGLFSCEPFPIGPLLCFSTSSKWTPKCSFLRQLQAWSVKNMPSWSQPHLKPLSLACWVLGLFETWHLGFIWTPHFPSSLLCLFFSSAISRIDKVCFFLHSGYCLIQYKVTCVNGSQHMVVITW